MFSDFNYFIHVSFSLHYVKKTLKKIFTDIKHVDHRDAQELFSQELVEYVRRYHKQNTLTKKLQTYCIESCKPTGPGAWVRLKFVGSVQVPALKRKLVWVQV